MGMRVLRFVVCLGAAWALVTVAASGEIIQAGNIDLRVDARVKPHRLPVKHKVPIELRASARIANRDGTPAPGLKRALIDFDIQGGIYTKGLASCKAPKIVHASTALAKKRCRRALVGTGSFTARSDEIAHVRGPLLIFYSRSGKRPGVLIHGYIPSPTGGEVVLARGVFKRAPGPVFGKRLVLKVPSFAGGTGRLTGISTRIGPRWHYRGKKRSFAVARCFAGNFVVQGDLKFTDGTHAQGSLIRGCRRKR